MYAFIQKIRLEKNHIYGEANVNYICVQGRDEPHLLNDGDHSDFSWQ